MPRKRNPNNNYFNEAVEQAVCAYLSTNNQVEKDKHFRIIYPALCKIAEVWFHKLKFSYSDDDVEDIMAGCVAWLVEKMDKFKCGQGTKAFSYYTVTAKFYYMQLSNKNYKYFQQNIPISMLSENWDMENTDREDERKLYSAKLLERFVEYCYHNMDEIFSDVLKPYARIVLNTLSNFEDIQDFRTRKVLQVIYKSGGLKENEKTKINKSINLMSAHLTLFKKRFSEGDDSLEICEKNTLTNEEIQIVKDTIVIGKKNNGTVALARKFGVNVKVINELLKTI